MTWIWATLLLILAAPFVLWPLIRAEPPSAGESGEHPAGAPPGASGPE